MVGALGRCDRSVIRHFINQEIFILREFFSPVLFPLSRTDGPKAYKILYKKMALDAVNYVSAHKTVTSVF